jgi:hypothetical protein
MFNFDPVTFIRFVHFPSQNWCVNCSVRFWLFSLVSRLHKAVEVGGNFVEK